MSKNSRSSSQFPAYGTTAGYFVYLARVRKGLTQRELADIAGVSESTVYALERDRHNITKTSRDLIFKVLDIEPYYYESLLESSTETIN